MSITYSLLTKLEKVKAGNRENLLCALSEIAEFDRDFNGENGLDYLWGEVWEANGFENLEDYEDKNEYDSDNDEDYEEIKLKYESNLAWLLDEVKDIEDDEECVNSFIATWMDNDGYYEEYEVSCLTDSKGRVTVISVAAMCGC